MKNKNIQGYCFIEKKQRVFVIDADNPKIAVCCSCPYRTKLIDIIK